MAGLRLGPLLRFVDWETGGSATVWVEADRPCTAEVRCADGAQGTSRTFQIAGHHYALVPVTGLTPGTTTAYEVLLDGRRVWPLDGSGFPPSTIRTPDVPCDGVTVSFGSCRWSAAPAGEHDPVGPDALDTLAVKLAAEPEAERPDVLLLLGDQVYADATSKATRAWLAARRDLREPPGAEVADYEEYTHLYDESWSDPEVRWLLSTVPSCMIFDDHDVIDDWNTSESWLAEMRRTPWWQERIVSGLMSYWVYQHLGNLSPAELESDELYAAVRAAPDGTDLLRSFAAQADADPACVRWSYRRDFGRTRLLMVDTRAGRVLDEQRRSMLDPDEAHWLHEQALAGRGSYDHLLIGTSLPWLLPPLIHDAEGWNAALCRGERGARWARFGEDLRRRADLEHWAAFPDSFEKLTRLIAEAGSGPDAPATVCVLSGDVHHAYVAEPEWPGGAPGARVLQLTCSPVHNSIPRSVQLGFRFGWSRTGRRLGHALARHGRAGRPTVYWGRTGGPWFGNQLMTLTLRGRSAGLRLDQARAVGAGQGTGPGGGARLVTAEERELTAHRDPSHSGG
ncbi:alkaline phosphatase D family protein [Streptomyces sp. NBC_01481]|uniref:alkaline phosphatase D family protein n=1 Tax=Streptomyces sp. NBC_01481 TaxID=2975869 RepID=UPI00225C345A|nr:alkaline phosphatase D family protein [Streptomyces sp. NBC_01481]MCX4582429.1 alkaline phosphatase family protein [Streptomyces sp. NBC_01481]